MTKSNVLALNLSLTSHLHLFSAIALMFWLKDKTSQHCIVYL